MTHSTYNSDGIGTPAGLSPNVCEHGGAFFDAIGVEFDDLTHRNDIINADVLDAWFPPSPKAIAAIRKHLSWLLHTSPPIASEGLTQVISRVRGIPKNCILPAAGSSELLYLAFRQWLNPGSRALVLDPSYGEYAHLFENVIGCRFDRFELSASQDFQVDLIKLSEQLKSHYNLLVLVNPNNPTGQHLTKSVLIEWLRRVPSSTRVWIDETYIEYVGADESLEDFASQSSNVVVCKSMSKVYGLSGARVGYLVANATIISDLQRLMPPWTVSLIAQVAAVFALQDSEYYVQRYEQTRQNRQQLIKALLKMPQWRIFSSSANFVLCQLPEQGPDSATLTRLCQQQQLFIRDLSRLSNLFGPRFIRLAVKDGATNNCMVEILRRCYKV